MVEKSQTIIIVRFSVLVSLMVCTWSQLIYHSAAHPGAIKNDYEQMKDH